MNTKTQLKIVVFFISLISIFVVALISFFLQSYQYAQNKANFASNVALDVFQRKILGDDYLSTSTERSKSQWLLKQAFIKEKIEKNKEKFQTEKEKEFYEKLQLGLMGSENVFSQIVSLREQTPVGTPSASFEDKESRLVNQLAIKAQETISAASYLSEINIKSSQDNLQQVIYLFFLTGLVYFILLLSSFWFIWRATRQLESEKLKDDALLASIGDGVVAFDAQGNLLFLNKVAKKMLKLDDGVVGKHYDILWQVCDQKGRQLSSHERPLSIALKTGREYIDSSRMYIRSDGTQFPVSVHITPIYESGRVTGVINIFRDITKEKELEKLKDEFLSIASHELRTPLTAIDGFISMIRDGDYGPLNKNLQQPLADINDASRRLIHLVNDLLNLSRINAGRLKYSLTQFDISPVIKETIELLETVAKQKKLTLKATAVDKVVIQADSDKVKQILTNLIGNSLKFTDNGGITVSTELQGKLVYVKVSDTGIGISAEDKDKLFGKFQQLDSGQGRPPGTGLGLHLSKLMAQKMGGDVWLAESTPGKGCTFAFSLPQANSKEAEKVKLEIEEEARASNGQKSDTIKS